MRTFDVCYYPIYAITERSSTVETFAETCVPLGRLTEGEEHHRKLMMVLGNMNAAFQRAEKARSNPRAFSFQDIRVRISAPGTTIFIHSHKEGTYNNKRFVLTDSELLKIERELGSIFDCMEKNEEEKFQKKEAFKLRNHVKRRTELLPQLHD